MNKKNGGLPKWIILWLTISMLIVFWDVMFILMRPASLEGGRLAAIWIPYATYIKIDTSYGDMNNDFVKAQAIISLFEIIIGITALYLNYILKYGPAILCAFSTLLLTGTKTILIFVLEMVGHFKHIGHNTLHDIWLLYVFPNALWIVIPFLAAFSLARLLVLGMSNI